MKTIRTEAIVLRRTNYGEADRVLQLITPVGKMSVMARAARKEKSKLAGGIELFGVSEVVIAEGKGNIGTLTSVRLVHFYNHILEDYDRMQFAYQAMKMIASASEMIDDPQWYEILQETLMGLDAFSVRLDIVQSWFYLHYASMMGHELSLDRDINDEKILADRKYRYDVGERGLRPVEDGELTAEHIKLLRLIITKPLRAIAQIGGVSEVAPDCFVLARQHVGI